jgi:hypothetical protein
MYVAAKGNIGFEKTNYLVHNKKIRVLCI